MVAGPRLRSAAYASTTRNGSMGNETKYLEFLSIAKLMNRQFNSIPILYGSLGLSRALSIDINANDIDILVEEEIFDKQLNAIHSLFQENGYLLSDIEENEFRKGDITVGIATDGDMPEFSGLQPSTLKIVDDGAKYRTLTPDQYLATYKASILDGYRKNIRKKDDASKIELIESVTSHDQARHSTRTLKAEPGELSRFTPEK